MWSWFNHEGHKEIQTKNTTGMTENEISKIVFDCGLKVHRSLGPGLLESAYEECLFFELMKTGVTVEKQKRLAFNL